MYKKFICLFLLVLLLFCTGCSQSKSSQIDDTLNEVGDQIDDKLSDFGDSLEDALDDLR